VSELDDSFASLLGRQPSDRERQNLYRVRDTLKLKNNDALWLLLMTLEHYDTLYRRYPALIVAAAKEVTRDIRETAAAQARAAAADTTKALAHAVAEAATASAKKAAGAQMLKWAMGCFMAATGCISTIGWWAHSKGQRAGYAVGYEAARDRYENAAAMASWANTPEGQLAYELAKAGSLRELATCSGHGWVERDGVCYPSSKTHGWRLPEGTADHSAERRPGG
jgi:hypothetical protein